MKGWNEKDLFAYLLKNTYFDLVKANKQMSRWDCYSPEIRHRIEKCKDNLDIPMYINSTPKGVYRFNLFLIEPNWIIEYHNKTTAFTNKNKVPKEIAMLPVVDAEIL